MSKTELTQGRKPRQVSADDRSRLALGKSGVGAYENFFVTVFETGQILLTPVVSIPKNEVPLWNDAEFMNSLTKGISQAVSGQTKRLDHLIPDSNTKKKLVKPQPRSRAKVKVWYAGLWSALDKSSRRAIPSIEKPRINWQI
jgi:hypothetical protein